MGDVAGLGERALSPALRATAGGQVSGRRAYAGRLRVYGLGELFGAVEILALAVAPKGPRVATLSNGGGLAVLATGGGGICSDLSLDFYAPPHRQQHHQRQLLAW
ncbi:MAG: hypothetical protein ACREKB_10645 [Candidatus Rokuibacteriota bacterium]